ncbi:LOW QUALITY PROTEIN: hypothetical protein YC2023_041050 [Brassica napus]
MGHSDPTNMWLCANKVPCKKTDPHCMANLRSRILAFQQGNRSPKADSNRYK